MKLPAGSVNADTPMVLWLDVESAGPDVLKKTRAAVDAVIPPEAARSGAPGWAWVEEFQKVFTDAGGRSVAIVMRSEPAAATEPAGAAAPATAPAQKDESVILIHLKAGTNLDTFVGTMREFASKQMKESNTPVTPDSDPNKVSAKVLADEWVYLTGPGLAAPASAAAGGNEALAAYDEALNRNPGAAVRLAVRMTDAMRRQLKVASLQTPPMFAFFGAILRNLTALQDADAGLVLGERPHIDAKMHFSDAPAAAAFKQSLDGVVTFVAMITQMAGTGDDPAAKAGMEALRTVLAPLLMDQKDADLTTSIDTVFVKKLVELQAAKPATAPAIRPQ